MKYSGSIIGLRSSFGSVYHVLVDDTRCYLWKGNVVADLSDKAIMLSFNWNGMLYELKLSLLKNNYYTGKIYIDREHYGEIYLWCFQSKTDLILKGDFIEFNAGNYECFIELKPFKT